MKLVSRKNRYYHQFKPREEGHTEKGKNDLERFFVKMEKDENDIREWMQMTRLISKM